MSEHACEIADIVRLHGDDYLERYGRMLSFEQQRALYDVARCRTSAMGGHVEACDNCGAQRNAYNSCRNRHCPKCQGSARARWTKARETELLPLPYFHVVFTVPQEIAPIALQNQRVVYGILFRAAAATLNEVAQDERHLGARIGFVVVLHTWGQTLLHHPHVHCVVAGGGLAPDGSHWTHCQEDFFLPVRVLSRVFRGKFLDLLYRAYDAGQIECFGKLSPLRSRRAFKRRLKDAGRQEWVVYSKRPFGGPRQVLRYLARYTHRVAIANSRIIDLVDGRVRFRWKDYADGSTWKTMTLGAHEFLRRFLLHVLPKGFVRIRYYGFLANRYRREQLENCHALLGSPHDYDSLPDAPEAQVLADEVVENASRCRCPVCGRGHMLTIRLVPRRMLDLRAPPPLSVAYDSS